VESNDKEIESMTFNESQHPRAPAGTSEGGQFASKETPFIPGVSGYTHGSTWASRAEYKSKDLEEGIRASTKEYLGKELSSEEVLQCAGILPGSRVTVSHSDNSITVFASILNKDAEEIGRQSRTLKLERKSIYNAEFGLEPEYRGRGLGMKALILEVRSAADAGFEKLETYAVGQDGSSSNGYYTWARLGFLPDPRVEPPKGFSMSAMKSVKLNMMKLMSTKSGRDWWKENGGSFHGVFDLTNGSVSRRVLDAYAKETGAQ
jgi:hypothetical protein